jgi:hypothetical protein
MISASVFSALGEDLVFGLAARHEVAIHANIPATYYLGHWLFPPGADILPEPSDRWPKILFRKKNEAAMIFADVA